MVRRNETSSHADGTEAALSSLATSGTMKRTILSRVQLLTPARRGRLAGASPAA
jgi:hypothetical protein